MRNKRLFFLFFAHTFFNIIFCTQSPLTDLIKPYLQSLPLTKQLEMLQHYAYSYNGIRIGQLLEGETDECKKNRYDLYEFCGIDRNEFDDIHLCISIYRNIKKDSFIVRAVQNNNVSVCQTLLMCGANVNATICKGGSRLLSVALSNGYNDIAQLLLLKKEIEVDYKEDKEIPLLSMATLKCNKVIFHLLLSHHDIDVNAKDTMAGYYVLHQLVIWAALQELKLLLAHKNINVNVQDEQGRTPLHVAVFKGLGEIIGVFFNHNAIDLTIKDNNGLTAYDIAKQLGYAPFFLKKFL